MADQPAWLDVELEQYGGWQDIYELPNRSAVLDMAEIHVDMWEEIGSKFTCSEADALVHLFAQLGLMEHAEALAKFHILGDYEGDEHYVEGVSREEGG